MTSDAHLLARREAGLSYKAIAAETGLSADSIRGRISRARRMARPSAAMMLALYAQLARGPDRPPDTPLVPADDRAEWQERAAAMAGLGRLARVLIMSDLHMPDHDPRALALAAQIAGWLHPDVIVLNGDTFDFPTISRFPTHHSHKHEDTFKAVRKPYTAFIQSLSVSCAGTAIIHLDGNHNARLGSYLSEHPQFLETILDQYAALIRADGRVLYMGEMQELSLPGLLIQHGRRAGMNAGKQALEDLGGNHPVVQGHTHRPATYHKRVYHRQGYAVVTSAVTGCLCNMPPQYMAHQTAQTHHWLQGVAVAHVDMAHGLMTNVQNIVFHPTPGALMAACGKHVWEVRA